MWGTVTNTSNDGMLTSFGIVWTQIHCLGQGSVADQPHTSRCPGVSVADITDCATSPANNNNGVDVEDALDNDVAVNVEDVYDNNNSVEGVYADDESVDVVVENVQDNDDAGGVV